MFSLFLKIFEELQQGFYVLLRTKKRRKHLGNKNSYLKQLKQKATHQNSGSSSQAIKHNPMLLACNNHKILQPYQLSSSLHRLVSKKAKLACNIFLLLSIGRNDGNTGISLLWMGQLMFEDMQWWKKPITSVA